MERSAAAVAEFNFDGLKLDSCSQFNNLTWWASLLNATGRRQPLSPPYRQNVLERTRPTGTWLHFRSAQPQEQSPILRGSKHAIRSALLSIAADVRSMNYVIPFPGREILIENCHQGGLDPPGNPTTNSEVQGASSPPYVNRDHPGAAEKRKSRP